jgi:hypothetical protein
MGHFRPKASQRGTAQGNDSARPDHAVGRALWAVTALRVGVAARPAGSDQRLLCGEESGGSIGVMWLSGQVSPKRLGLTGGLWRCEVAEAARRGTG